MAAFLDVPAERFVKTLIYQGGEGQAVAVLVRGDHEASETKVYNEYIEGVQTRVDTQTPTEIRWLVMYSKLSASELRNLGERFGAVSSVKPWLLGWLSQSSRQNDQQLKEFLSRLQPVQGSWGSGRLLAGTAFSAVWTDDGRLAVGAVRPDLIYQTLSR